MQITEFTGRWSSMFKFKYVDVKNGVVVGLQESQKEILSKELILVGELPVLGSTYDEVLKTFTVPVVEVELIREITLAAFRTRFTFAEKIAIESSTDAGIRVLEKDLAARSMIRLNLKQLKDGLNYYVSKGLLAAGRVSKLLQDGTTDEVQ